MIKVKEHNETVINAYDAWLMILDNVMEFGHECSPRGMKIKELVGTQITLDCGKENLIYHPHRELNYRFAVAEWLWIQAGRKDVAFPALFNKQIAKFSDDGITFAGAYGPRLQDQWSWLLETLRSDRDTRQAVVTIWDRRPARSKDIPCTLGLQVLLRENKLHGVFTMRSQDLYLGYCYDIYNFGQILNGLAGAMGVETGSLTLNTGSSHIYEPNFEKVRSILNCSDEGYCIVSPQLSRVPPAYLMTQIVETMPHYRGRDLLTVDEECYVDALQVKTSAEALEILRDL